MAEVEGRRRVRTRGRRIGHVGERHTVVDYVMEEEERRSRVEDYEVEERRTGLEGDHAGPAGHHMVAEGDTGYVMVRRMGVAVVADSRVAAEEGSRPDVAAEDIVLAADILVAGRMVEEEERRSPAVAVDSPGAGIGPVEAGRSPVAVLRTGDSHLEADMT